MIRENIVETLVGAVVIVVAAIFFVFAYQTSGVGAGRGGYRIEAQFARIDGVNIGTDVRMSGIKIGTVVDQKLDPVTYEAVVTLAVNQVVKVPEDSTAKITSEGLLGDTYISLEPGGSETMLADGGQLTYTQGSINIFDLIGKFLFDGGGKKTGGDGGAGEGGTGDAGTGDAGGGDGGS